MRKFSPLLKIGQRSFKTTTLKPFTRRSFCQKVEGQKVDSQQKLSQEKFSQQISALENKVADLTLLQEKNQRAQEEELKKVEEKCQSHFTILYLLSIATSSTTLLITTR